MKLLGVPLYEWATQNNFPALSFPGGWQLAQRTSLEASVQLSSNTIACVYLITGCHLACSPLNWRWNKLPLFHYPVTSPGSSLWLWILYPCELGRHMWFWWKTEQGPRLGQRVQASRECGGFAFHIVGKSFIFTLDEFEESQNLALPVKKESCLIFAALSGLELHEKGRHLREYRWGKRGRECCKEFQPLGLHGDNPPGLGQTLVECCFLLLLLGFVRFVSFSLFPFRYFIE